MATTLLPGQSPPLTIITSTNQTGVLLITTSLALVIAVISLLIRIYLQLQIRQQYALDNVLALVSMVSCNILLSQNSI